MTRKRATTLENQCKYMRIVDCDSRRSWKTEGCCWQFAHEGKHTTSHGSEGGLWAFGPHWQDANYANN